MPDKEQKPIELKVIELPKKPKFWYWYGCNCDRQPIFIDSDINDILCPFCDRKLEVIAHVPNANMECIKLAAKCFK